MANSKPRALESYRLAGSWREAFSLAKQMNFSIDEIQSLAYQILGKKRKQQSKNDWIITSSTFSGF